jgi:hypothetical protein
MSGFFLLQEQVAPWKLNDRSDAGNIARLRHQAKRYRNLPGTGFRDRARTLP